MFIADLYLFKFDTTSRISIILVQLNYKNEYSNSSSK